MAAIIKPTLNFSILSASQLTEVKEQKVLIIGQMLTGSATAGSLVPDVQNDGSENELFGRKSHIAGMIRDFKKINKVSKLDAIALEDAPTAVPAKTTFVINSTPTEDGDLNISLGSKQKHSYDLEYAALESFNSMATRLKALVDADLDAPFVVTIEEPGDYIHFDSANGGELGNDWDIRFKASGGGLTAGIFQAWSGGATNPDLTNLFDVVANTRYQTIVWPSAYPTAELETYLNSRFNYDNEIMDGVGVVVKRGTLSEIKTYADQNSQSIVVIGNKFIDFNGGTHPYAEIIEGSMVAEFPDSLSSMVAAVRALRLSKDASITDYIATAAPDDQFGGISLASLPYFNTFLPDVAVPRQADMWSHDDQKELEEAGISLLGANSSFSKTILGEFVTTYLTDELGNPDDSFHFLNTVDTISVLREYFYENCRQRYAQTRLTNGDLIPGKAMANLGSIRAFFNRLYAALSKDAITQSGTAALKDFNQNLLLSLDLQAGQVSFSCAPLLVGGLRVIIGSFKINFGGVVND